MASAQSASGYRTVLSLAGEMSSHLLQPILSLPLLVPVSPGSPPTPQTAELADTSALYPGALIAVGVGTLDAEVVTVIAVTTAGSPPGPAFTALFLNPHAAGDPVESATFPIQSASGDQLFTQSEILGYVARAQNEFLAAVPHVYELTENTVTVGQIRQTAPANMIEIARLASVAENVAISTLSRVSGTVTATSADPHGLTVGEPFSIFGAADSEFDGAFVVDTVPSSTAWTYAQPTLPDASTTGGNAGLWSRAWPVSQEQLSFQDPTWRSQYITGIESWFEDRQGLYGYGVNGLPGSNFPVQLLCSIRDDATLSLLDGFLVPDPFLHAVKYKALEYCWSKDGEMQDARRAVYCRSRYDRVVLAVARWLHGAGGMGAFVPPSAQSQSARKGRG